jgi:predicted nucleic-acid-binding protein
MIGLDTNVLVRYLAQDDPVQSAAATELVEGFTAEAPGFISTVTLVETAWVLARAYKTPPLHIAAVIEGLLRARELVVEQSEMHYLALATFQARPVDYADAVIAQTGRRAGCDETVTFDRRAAKGAKMRLLEPVG